MEGDRIYVYPGQLIVRPAPKILTTVLGSCVSVCMWDRQRRYGGMNHYMLPRSPNGSAPSARYGDVSIVTMIRQFLKYELKVRDLEAYIVGGGNPVAVLRKVGGIGEKNVRLAKALLGKYGIPIVGEHTGWDTGCKLRYQSGSNMIHAEPLARTRSTDWIDESGKPLTTQESTWRGPERRNSSAPQTPKRLDTPYARS